MTFQKSFPRKTDKSVYPIWEEIELNDSEELKVEELAKDHNKKLFSECVEDARKLCVEKDFSPEQTDIIKIAIALFEKRASHQVYWKEKATKEKFDKK